MITRSIALAGAAVLALAALGSALPQRGPTPVRVDEVRQELVVDRRLVTGDVRAVRRSAVATREKGLVLELAVREGQSVAAGDLLARLDAELLELDVAVLEAQRKPAEALQRERSSDLAQKESDLEALRRLEGRGAANPKELSDAQTAREAAEARLRQAEGELMVLTARIAHLQKRLEGTHIRAPFPGTIIARRTEVGAWLGEGEPVVELVSTGDLEVWLEVPQKHLAAIQSGAGSVRVRVDATAEVFELEDYRVIPDVDTRARTFRLVAPVTSGDEGSAPTLAAGMSVTAEVPAGTRAQRITISRDALLRNEVGTYVYLVVPGDEGEPARAAPMQVEVAFHVNGRAALRDPRLAPGAQVVVEGNERLFPMAPIQPRRSGGGAEGSSR